MKRAGNQHCRRLSYPMATVRMSSIEVPHEMFIVSSDTLRAFVTKITQGPAPPHRARRNLRGGTRNFLARRTGPFPVGPRRGRCTNDPDGRVSRTSEGDAMLGFEAFLLLMGASLMLTALVVSRRSQQTG